MQFHIISDFVDFYDHLFASQNEAKTPFYRMTSSDWDQRTQFEFLIRLGENVPHYGKLGCVLDVLDRADDLIVVHCEENDQKRLMTRSEALLEPGHLFSSAFILHDTGRAITWRWLQVGDHPFLLEYASDHAWSSRSGTVAVRVIKASPIRKFVPHIPYPLWAMDFIPLDNNSKRIAIKFSTAPVLQGTGVEEFMTSEEIVSAIVRGIVEFDKKTS